MSNQLIIPEKVKALATDDLLDNLEVIQDNMEAIDNFQVPRVLFKDSVFTIPGLEPYKSFEATILASKTTRTYYKDAWNPKVKVGPVCASNGGRVPTDGTVAQSDECRFCDHNPLAGNYDNVQPNCKQKKELMLHLEGSAIPCILRVPATSIRSVDDAISGLLMKGLKYWHAKLKFEIYKKDTQQTYDNIRVSFVDKVDEPDDMTALQLFWKEFYEHKKASADSSDQAAKQEEAQDVGP